MSKSFSPLGAFLAAGALAALASCAPQVTGFDPKTGSEGTDVTIRGDHFRPGTDKNVVWFGGVRAADIKSAEKGRIVAIVPRGARMGRIQVETRNGKGESADSFTLFGKGYALAIGLNALDPSSYGEKIENLTGCEPDAKDMDTIARQQDFETAMLLTAQATRQAVLDRLKDLAERLVNGDLLVVSFSGHGGCVPDMNGDEADGNDETWCLYDGQLLDDELYEVWTKFREGVRILVFSDSCFSGTILRMIRMDLTHPQQVRLKSLIRRWESNFMAPEIGLRNIRSLAPLDLIPREDERIIRNSGPSETRVFQDDRKAQIILRHKIAGTEMNFSLETMIWAQDISSRSLSPDVMSSVYQQHRAFYDALGAQAPRENVAPVSASVILISGCAESQAAIDLVYNGLFTLALKQAWKSGEFSGSHLDFLRAIQAKIGQISKLQSPQLVTVGATYEAFVRQKPYTVVRAPGGNSEP